jgi:hypothetical protein
MALMALMLAWLHGPSTAQHSSSTPSWRSSLVALTMLAGHRLCGSGWLVADWAAQET